MLFHTTAHPKIKKIALVRHFPCFYAVCNKFNFDLSQHVTIQRFYEWMARISQIYDSLLEQYIEIQRTEAIYSLIYLTLENIQSLMYSMSDQHQILLFFLFTTYRTPLMREVD